MLKDNENLNIAYEYSNKNFSHGEIFDILKGDNELLKPIAVLNLLTINTESEAELLLSHLTGVNGKIREVVSFKITELYPKCSRFLNAPELFAEALCDVNPNVVRNILELLKNFEIKQELIMARVEEILKEIDAICSKFKKNREKSHALNIKLFNLYWCLEAIYIVVKETDERLNSILLRCSEMYDYTIREKVAKIAVKAKGIPEKLLQKLHDDDNYYVRRYLNC